MQPKKLILTYGTRHQHQWKHLLVALVLVVGSLLALAQPASAQSTPGAALDFDGSNDYVTLPSTLNQQFGANRITIAGWFYPTASPTTAIALIGEQYTDDGNIRFVLQQGDSVVGCGFQSSGSGWTQTPVAAWNLNTWQHVACTYDQQNIKLYINGVVVATQPATAALPSSYGEWYVGRQWYYADTYKGQMDEMRIWNRALTTSEIATEMCTPGTLPSGLVAYYNFNQGTALANNSGVTTLTDSSGNNRNGTLTNFALTGSTSNWVAPGFANGPICNPAPSLAVQGSGVSLVNGDKIHVPVTFTGNGATIASVGFALDYQESCLVFDATDSDSDGLPDAITGLPAAFTPSISHQPTKTSGELEVALYDSEQPITTFSDGTLFTVQFTVNAACRPTAGAPTNVAVNFAAAPAASFGDPTGVDVVGTASGATITLQATAPTAIALSNSSIAENSPANTTVGAFSSTDPTANDSHTYTFVSGAGDTDNASFIIEGNTLKSAAVFDYETKSSYTIRVRTTDNSGNFFEQSFTITVTDVDETPIAVDDLVDPRTTVFLGGQSGAIDVLANDLTNGGMLQVTSVTQPTNGGGSVTNNTTDVSYTAPNTGSSGSASFTYQATNGSATSNSANVTVNYVANHARGDCNGNGGVSAADFIGVVLEIFDANNTLYQGKPAWWLTYTGDFVGSPLGCDANNSRNGADNSSASVTAADIICSVLIFFGHPCGTGVQAADTNSIPTLSVTAVNEGAQTTIPVTLQSRGQVVAGAAFALTLGDAAFDATDADGDGVPDAVTLNVPAGVMKSVSWNAQAKRLEVALYGASLPLPTLSDGVLATVTVDGEATPTLTLVSLSDTNGNDLLTATRRGLFLPLATR
jgi:hypothetical protein